MLTILSTLGSLIVGEVGGYIKRRQAISEAVAQNKIRLAQSEQDHNQDWEMKSLDNAGWKDEVLFYSIIAMYVYSAFDPVGASAVFRSWEALPGWWLEITGWLVASILGVKKIGEYLPGLISGVKSAALSTPSKPSAPCVADTVKAIGGSVIGEIKKGWEAAKVPEESSDR